MTGTEFGLALPGELDALAAVEGWAFGFPAVDARAWLERPDVSGVRVARRSGRVAGGLIEIRMGQWFGGRSVTNLGVAGVAVAPESRGGRVALDLVIDALRAARRAGTAVSTLYPASHALYRAAGYELSGSRFRWSLASRKLKREESALAVQPIEPGHTEAVEAAYRHVAAARNGYLDRGPYVWRRVREGRVSDGRDGVTRGFAVMSGSRLDGYAYIAQHGPEEQRQLIVRDLVALTPESLRRLVRLVADHQTTLPTTVFHGAAVEPFVFALPEGAGRVELVEHWMLRVVDVERALGERGYPELDAAVDFEVLDDILVENAGRFRLEVARGSARVSHGGSGRVRLDVRGLAPLYSGFLPPADLARAGLLQAEEHDLRVLRDLFAGPSPAMTDFF